jgi:hypothetical protein
LRSTGPIQFFSRAKKWIWPARGHAYSRLEAFKSCATRSIRRAGFAAATPARESHVRAVLQKRRLASLLQASIWFGGNSQYRAKPAAVACSRTPRGRFSSLMVSEAILVRGRGELANPARRLTLASCLLPLVFVAIGAVSPPKLPLSNFTAGPQTGPKKINLLVTLSRQDRAIGGCVP